MVDEPIAPTAKGVVEFLTATAARGDMNGNTAGAMKAAVREVLSSVEGDAWENVDVSKLDVDRYADRFARLRATKYKAASLKVYQARFRNAIDMFLKWRANPAEWKYTAERPYKERQKSKQAGTPNGSTTSAVNTTNGQEPPGVHMIDYPYPLRKGLLVTLRLPADLTRQEATRLQAYVSSLAFDEQSALPPGER